MKKALLINHHSPFDSGTVSHILFNAHYSLTTINSIDIKYLKLSEIKSYNLVCIFGGRASANDKSLYIKSEFLLIEQLSKLKIPTIGICLGAQLIAKFYGSKIISNSFNNSEIGYCDIIDPNLKFFDKNDLTFMQFHNQGICNHKSLEILGRGRFFDIDAFKIKDMPFFGFQFHPEVEILSISRWYKSNNEKISKNKDNLSKILKDYETYNKSNYFWLKKKLLKISS